MLPRPSPERQGTEPYERRISDGFTSPLDLVEIGLMSAEEARGLHEPEDPAELTAARLAASVGGVSQSFVGGAGRFGVAGERIVSQANPRSAGGGPVKKA